MSSVKKMTWIQLKTLFKLYSEKYLHQILTQSTINSQGVYVLSSQSSK